MLDADNEAIDVLDELKKNIWTDAKRTEIIAAALRAAERAGMERDIQAVIGVANDLPADCDDGFYAGYKLACRNALAAIRAAAASPVPATPDADT